MIKTTNVVAAVLLFSGVFSFLFVGYTNGINLAVAQTANTSEPGS